MNWPHWSFKEFVGTVNTQALSSVINALLWLATGLWTLHAMEWVINAPNATIALTRVGALVALLPFHAAWCGYLTVRSGLNVAQKVVNRGSDPEYLRAKGDADAVRIVATQPAVVRNQSVRNGTLAPTEPNALHDDERGEEV